MVLEIESPTTNTTQRNKTERSGKGESTVKNS